MNTEEYKQKIFERLETSGWGEVLKPFIFSLEFEKILITLYNFTKIDKRFTPSFKDMFRAFEECPYSDLKLIIVNNEPYNQINMADGISFSCSKMIKPHPILKFILEDINTTVYSGHSVSIDKDLKRWSNQGILMLNTSLTAEINKPNQHHEIWKPFIAYLFDYFNNYNKKVVYIYMGKIAQEWSEYVENDYKIFISHPASAAYTKQLIWNSNNTFLKVQQLVAEIYGYVIKW
jgi:uracil-DNA glycosylase